MGAIQFLLNDRPVSVDGLSPNTTLLHYLRDTARLTGAKEGCAEGDCGACSVAFLDQDGEGRPLFRTVNSCLILLPMVHGRKIYTVESLARDSRLHPVQAAMVETSGSQCGFCTPGFIMSLFEASHRDSLEAWQLDEQICGNLCRCTGYRPILEALETVAQGPLGDDFSPQLEAPTPSLEALNYSYQQERFHRPTSLAELWTLRSRYPEAKLINGGTDLSLSVTVDHQTLPHLISLEGLEKLNSIEPQGEGWRLGAGVPLTDVQDWAESQCPVLFRMLRFFASRQIKHRATLGGNLANASPVGDTPPVLLALDASVELHSARGIRTLSLSEFFQGYRQTALADDEIIAAVLLPPPSEKSRLGAYKVSKRRELDISTVCAAFRVEVVEGRIEAARLAFGGMAAIPARAYQAEAVLEGQTWGVESIRSAMEVLESDFQPISDLRASAWYRMTLAKNLLRGFYEECHQESFTPLPAFPSGTVVQKEDS